MIQMYNSKELVFKNKCCIYALEHSRKYWKRIFGEGKMLVFVMFEKTEQLDSSCFEG